ncbi:hypothetical protein M413DRAFT_440707 [Hebeloma cylindrosporum]|uniref:Uncharacterized protein n=1 Tax=Hebeloma cylindrosporum TaxID=76867 RepID=A0A0C3CT07_HEBCY|nr:hypothetical protein M413DRAFT_440707 [Hebeloma cylindrosporum h7]
MMLSTSFQPIVRSVVFRTGSAVQLKGTANELFSAKNYEGASSLYTKIIRDFAERADPEFIRGVQCNRAACMIEMGDFQGAIPDLEEVIRKAPKEANSLKTIGLTQKAHHRLARCLFELGKLTDALKEMDRYRDIPGGGTTEAATTLRNRIIEAIVLRDESRASTRVPSSGNSKVLRYEVKVTVPDQPSVSIVNYDTVALSLCTMHPPEMPTKMFLADLVKKYHESIMQERNWTCWNCRRKAVSLVHTPGSYLHLAEPMVVDFAQPVCVNGGECDKAARKMMDEERRFAAAAMGGMNRR